jgi:hypothetical protein
MKKLKFDGLEVEISEDELNYDVFDVNFGGSMMVQFTRQEDGTLKPTNAMNGWGNNCFNEISDKEVVIE